MAAAASFNTETLSISLGSNLAKPSAPATPSITTSGVLSLKPDTPRISMVLDSLPGSNELEVTVNPGSLPVSALVKDATGAIFKSSPLT